MASRFLLLLLLLLNWFFLFSNGERFDLSKNPLFVIPITKDASTLQYSATFRHGDPLSATSLVVDLNAPFSWMLCGPPSPGRRIVPRGSTPCLSATNLRVKSQDYCSVLVENGIGRVRGVGDLVEEIVAVGLVDRSTEVMSYVCVKKPLLRGLASGTRGVFGLGRSRVSIPSQASSVTRHHDTQFTMCLSDTNGVVLVEDGRFSSHFGSEISNSMAYTRLLTGQRDEYSVAVKSVNVGGKKLSFDLKTTKLSTVVSYTTMQSPIYDVFSKAYLRAASAMNMTRVGPVGPFGLCFETLRPNGPEIELVLQSELVKWRLGERNSLVRVSERVSCLGFLDGGLDLEDSIVLGGLQLEDFVLHFDVANSMLGFSPSLLTWHKSCSDFEFGSLVESM